MVRLLVLLVLIFMPLSQSFALTIDEAVSLAVDSNNTIKQQQESIAAKKYGVEGAYLIYFPIIGISYEAAYAWDDSVRVGGTRSSGDTSTASAYLKFNIFNGLNDYSTVGMAKLDYEMQNSQLVNTSYNITLNAQNSFINVLKAKSSLEVAISNLELLKLQKRDAELSAANGLISKADVLQVDTYLASAELQRISAESSLKIATKTLENIINRELQLNEVLIEPAFDTVNIPEYKSLKDMMYENRSDLKYQQQSYEVSRKNETKSLSGVYPTIDLNAGYYRYGDGINAFRGIESQKRDEVASVGVTASWNITGIAVSSINYMSKKRDTQAIAYGIADTKQSMSLELDTALANYETSQAQLVQSKISVQYATENYRVKKNLYDQNAATQTDLLDAVQILNQAKLDETSAIYGVIYSIYSLERIAQAKFTSESPDGIQPNQIQINEMLQDNGTSPKAQPMK